VTGREEPKRPGGGWSNHFPPRKLLFIAWKMPTLFAKNKFCFRACRKIKFAYKRAMSRPRLISLLLALVTLVVYLPVRTHSFVNYDDTDYVTENSFVKNGLSWTDLKWAFTTFHASNWHPLTWISHMADCQLFGPNAGAQHFVNVLFHAANAALLFILLWRLTGAIWPSAFVAALFAWHPLHVESVAWISERKDVLSTFFALLALLSYTKYVKENRRRNFWLALIFFALGLMSKPMLVTLPFVMLLLDYWPLQRFSNYEIQISKAARLVLEKIPFFIFTAISCAVTFFAQRSGEAIVSLKNVSLPHRLENAPLALGRYLLKIVWPANLAVIYPMPDKISPLAVAASAAVLILISAGAWFARRRNPYLPVGWLWFLGMLVPVIGLVQVGGAALADRYTYFPATGIFIIVAFAARDLANRLRFPKIIFSAASVLVLVACVILTEKQLRYWRDSETLFRHAIAVTKDNDIAFVNLGVALDVQGKFDEALAQYREALRIAPGRYQIHNNVANILDKIGRPEAALAEYRAAIRLEPKMAFLHNAAGETLVELGRLSEALDELTNAAQLDPGYAAPHFQMGKVFLKQGRDAEAMDQFHAALSLDPENFKILTYVARVLAAAENPEIRDGKTALLLAANANALTGGQQPLVLDALGMACAETGDFTNAIEVARRALDLATAAKMENLEPLRQRIELYKNHQPWRESFLATNAPPQNPPVNGN
jgi:protein O-mannosyl-transferase